MCPSFQNPRGTSLALILEGDGYGPSLSSKRLIGPPKAHTQPKRLGAAGMVIAVAVAAASAVGLSAMHLN